MNHANNYQQYPMMPPATSTVPVAASASSSAAASASSVTTTPWCSVQYYELKTKVGESFHAAGREFVIDGFTCPSATGRLSLGALSNVNRAKEVESVRRRIGHGIAVRRDADGEVRLSNLSAREVFVQAPCVNFATNPGAVMRLDAGCDGVLVFSLKRFLEHVHALRSQFPPREALNRTQALCSIRLSFVKGWGQNYQLQCIMSTPCHCELIFNEAYRELDSELTNPGLVDMPSSMS